MGIFDFDSFALKDIWKGIKKNPERLLLGAVDPWSTKMWNGITGKDYEPLVDQMGGPYGGHTLSAYGNNDGGVYARARAAGIDTTQGEQMHDVAHTIAAIFGAQGLGGGLGNAFGGGGGGGNLGIFANGGKGGLAGVGGGNAGALANSSAISGGAGSGLGMGGGMGSMQKYIKAAQAFQQQQPQQQPAPYMHRGGGQVTPAVYQSVDPGQMAQSRAAQALKEELERKRISEMFA